MAGAGFKTFTVGEVLTSSDVNQYLMQQAVMKFASSGARGSAIGTATEGMVSYLDDTDAVEVYDGSSWVGVSPAQTGIIQVVSAVKTTAQAGSVAEGAAWNITDLEVTITPTSASNKVLVVVSITSGSNNSYELQRDDTDIAEATSVGSRGARTFGGVPSNDRSGSTHTFHYLDSPATTSAVKYDIVGRLTVNGGGTYRINASSDDSDSSSRQRYVSTITAMEVAV